MKIARMLITCLLVLAACQSIDAQSPQEGSRSSADPNQDAKRKQQKRRDQLKIAVQEICPTTGAKLREHGTPIKVKVGEETIFLCCKGCLKKKIDPKHWVTIHANFAKAQRICPIMKKELPKNPKWSIVNGQIVYVCCPPCTKKIDADPVTFLDKLDQLYTASLREDRLRR